MGRVLGAARACVALVAAGTLVIGALSLSGAFSGLLDGFAQLAPLWGAVAVLALVLAAALSAWRSALAALGALLCAGLLIGPPLVRALNRPEPPSRPPDLTLVQFNLWALNKNPEATAAWIRAQSPDVIAIEEVEGPALLVRDRLEAAGYHSAGRCAQRRRCRSLVLSRWPVLGGDSLARAPNWISASELEAASPQGPVAVTAAHTGWPWPADRARAQRGALTAAEADTSEPCRIVAGDFNASPWSFALGDLERGLGLERRTGVQATWPARPTNGAPIAPPFPVFAIDHIFASACWRMSRVSVGPRLGSDHYPLLAKLWR